MNTGKTVKKYSRLYRAELRRRGYPDVKEKAGSYRAKLLEMYASDKFREHNVYPTMNVPHIYAVIAICLELKDFGLSDAENMSFINGVFRKRKKKFARIIKLIDRLPNSFEIAKKWNISDHEKRVQDGSITYDCFCVGGDYVEYRISRCMYVEMFEYYGIRGLCKIFCNTDIQAYGGLTRHVRFIRHSDLSDGDCCFDEVHRK